jgi:polyhydroxyalkanoate synthesis regulator phasin
VLSGYLKRYKARCSSNYRRIQVAQRPDLTRFIDAGAGFVSLTRGQATASARDLVSQGLLAQNQVQAFVDGILEESRRRRDSAISTVRTEVGRQVKLLGLITKEDLADAERRLRKELGSKSASKASGATKAPVKKATVKNATVKKATVKKAPAKKAPVKRTTAKRSA